MQVREATVEDLPDLLRLLFADRATPSDEAPPEDPCYREALLDMQASLHSRTYVALQDGRIVGTFMLTFLRHLMRRGALVAQIEAVRVDASLRSRGLGRQMMEWAVAESRRRGCAHLQLTSNKSRKDAHRFYQRLGFKMSHEGMKLAL
ncbi:MAG TPA: GNAT family N-acetyltransferase [Myxococcales bacterium]|nr:GNAT family N-acetyltransferase [Myxococcales bacterium]